jgi:excisionase family DNA binding protein
MPESLPKRLHRPSSPLKAAKADGKCRGEPAPERSNGNYLKISEVAEELNIGVRSVWRLIEEKELPKYRFCGSTRVKRGDLDAYIERSRR